MVLSNSVFWASKANTKEGFFETPKIAKNRGNVHPITGYRIIGLKQKKNGQFKNEYLHRAIWMAYHKKQIPKGFQIMHMNHNREDCRISNLQLGTPSENTLASVPNRSRFRKRTHYRNKCRAQSPSGKIHTFASVAECSRVLGLSSSTVSKALRNEPYCINALTADKKKYKILQPK
jgi:hypothetical protein